MVSSSSSSKRPKTAEEPDNASKLVMETVKGFVVPRTKDFEKPMRAKPPFHQALYWKHLVVSSPRARADPCSPSLLCSRQRALLCVSCRGRRSSSMPSSPSRATMAR